MSTDAEKRLAIAGAVELAKKIVFKYETLLSIGSKLHKTQEYELEMARDCVKRGESILKDHKPSGSCMKATEDRKS